MNANRTRLTEEFVKLVSIDSPSFGEKQMGDYVKNRLLSLGFNVTEDDTGDRIGGNCGNIYGVLDGNDGADTMPLLFCAHLDTVEPSVGKQAVIGEDGVIRSRGDTVLGADDCSGIVAILEALSVIREQGLAHGPIEVLFSVAEEVYCDGIKQFDATRIRSKEAYILDLTGPVGGAACGAPTILTFEAAVHGRSAHAGFAPEDGIHAIAAAADAIGKIRTGHVGKEATVNIGQIQGGGATNIVPDRCTVKGEIRSYSHNEALDQLESIQAQFDASAQFFGATVDFNMNIRCEAYRTPHDHPVVRRFVKACEERQLPLLLTETFGGSDNNILAGHGICGIVVANAMNHCHSCNEYTTVEELVRIADLTITLMTIG